MYQQYKLMESSLLQKQRKLQGQLVEIKSTLGILEYSTNALLYVGFIFSFVVWVSFVQ